MTREQILAMDTGREFDYLVGEKVMNYSIYHYDKDHPDGCYYMLVDENFEPVTDEVGWSAGERKTEKEAWKDCPNYSTDIAAAFKVEERMILEKGHAQIAYLQNIFHICGIPRQPLTSGDIFKLIRLTPEQRCKAAVLAKMGYWVLEEDEGSE